MLAGLLGASSNAVANGEVLVYRGARNPNAPVRGPAYFATEESFAATYGPTQAFRLQLQNPYIVSRAEWKRFANTPYYSLQEVVAELEAQSEEDGTHYDSVLADFGTLWVAFVLDAAATARAPDAKRTPLSWDVKSDGMGFTVYPRFDYSGVCATVGCVKYELRKLIDSYSQGRTAQSILRSRLRDITKKDLMSGEPVSIWW